MWKGKAEYKRKSLQRQINKETTKAKRRKGKSENLPSRCSSTRSGAFISLGSFLSEQEKGNGDIKTELFFSYTIGVESYLGTPPPPPKESNLCRKKKPYLTITDWAALVLGLYGSGAGQYGTDDWVTNHSSFLQKKKMSFVIQCSNNFLSLLLFICFMSHFSTKTFLEETIRQFILDTNSFRRCHYVCRLYLAAAGETLVVVGGPAGAVSVVLVLKEACMGVLL